MYDIGASMLFYITMQQANFISATIIHLFTV